MKYFFIFFAAASINMVPIHSEPLQDFVSISGVITHFNPAASIYIALFSNDNNFNKGVFYKTLRFPRENLPADSQRFSFTGVKPGTYLMAFYQDLNNDQVLNKGLFGRPTEPYRLYRPFSGIFAPKFSDCAFSAKTNLTNVNIRF